MRLNGSWAVQEEIQERFQAPGGVGPPIGEWRPDSPGGPLFLSRKEKLGNSASSNSMRKISIKTFLNKAQSRLRAPTRGGGYYYNLLIIQQYYTQLAEELLFKYSE